MESPPTTGQKNILFIKVARGYQNWHRRTYLLSMKIIFHHHIQSTFKHMECFGKSIRHQYDRHKYDYQMLMPKVERVVRLAHNEHVG